MKVFHEERFLSQENPISDLILDFLFHGTNSLVGKANRHKNHHKSNPAVLTRESIIIEPGCNPYRPQTPVGLEQWRES